MVKIIKNCHCDSFLVANCRNLLIASINKRYSFTRNDRVKEETCRVSYHHRINSAIRYSGPLSYHCIKIWNAMMQRYADDNMIRGCATRLYLSLHMVLAIASRKIIQHAETTCPFETRSTNDSTATLCTQRRSVAVARQNKHPGRAPTAVVASKFLKFYYIYVG